METLTAVFFEPLLALAQAAVVTLERCPGQGPGTLHVVSHEPLVPEATMESRFRHGDLSGLVECDEWIATTIRKLPRGALAKLYRILYEGEGLRIDTAKSEERKWLDSLKGK